VSQQPISDGTDAIAALLAYGERMESDTPRTDANEWRTRVGDLRVVDADFARKLERELAAMEKQRDEAYGLICGWWRKNAVEIVDDGESMYAMTPAGQRAMMNDADKRAFLEATTPWMGEKEGGGA
jgi:hypothetical protein